uniref:Uncharacterized protein n=1 Tax=Ficedula albicollis TaxID=59894 RepID=A0A803VMH2_FICAL
PEILSLATSSYRSTDTHAPSDTLPSTTVAITQLVTHQTTLCSPGLSTDSRQLPTFLPHLHDTNRARSSPFAKHTHKFKHVPVKDVVVGEALAVEEVAEELPQVRVVGFIIKPQEQRTADGCCCKLVTWAEIKSPLVTLSTHSWAFSQ